MEDGYEFLKAVDESEENDERTTYRTVPTDPENKRQYEWNALANNSILCGLVDAKLTKVMQCTTKK